VQRVLHPLIRISRQSSFLNCSTEAVGHMPRYEAPEERVKFTYLYRQVGS
jgi:hypothetical protein